MSGNPRKPFSLTPAELPHLATAVRRLHQAAEMKSVALAEAIGISKYTMSRIENAQLTHAGAYTKLCAYFECADIPELLQKAGVDVRSTPQPLLRSAKLPVRTLRAIRLVRESEALTMEDLAKALDISWARYRHFERGEAPLPPSLVEKIPGIILGLGSSMENIFTQAEKMGLSDRTYAKPRVNNSWGK